MDSFAVRAVGRLARDPDFVTQDNTTYARFCLIGNDYAGKDDQGEAREAITSLWFTAFGKVGQVISTCARKGDQLIVDGRIRANNWIDNQGEKQYDLSFIVNSFKFGAPGPIRREELNSEQQHSASPIRESQTE